MNVACPQCQTVFRVDPAKVPERGVRARCSVCSGLISVRRPDVAAPAIPVERAMEAKVEPSFVPPPPPPPPAPAPAAAVVIPPVVVEPPRPEPAPYIPPPAVEEPPPVPVPAVAEPAPEPVRTAPPARFTNPFLQQDPAARARRLARALVSDLVVYHPEKRQRGLADGSLKELFAEEIRKSIEEYREQVGDDVADTTPYFVDALNEILAEGQQIFG